MAQTKFSGPVASDNGFRFVGSSGFVSTMAPTALTANRTITIPDASGTLLLNSFVMDDVTSPTTFAYNTGVGTVVTVTDRYDQVGSSWTSTGPSGFSIYGYGGFAASTVCPQWFTIALGNGGMSNTATTYFGDSSEGEVRRLEFSTATQNVGHFRQKISYYNSLGYNPVTIRLLPIRNISSSAISIDVYGYCSSYYSSGYDGSMICSFTPNVNGSYAAVTGGTWTIHGYSQTNSSFIGVNASLVSIPANTTVIFMLVSTHNYGTVTGTSVYYTIDNNQFYNLTNTFSNANIQVDARMLTVMNQCPIPSLSAGSSFAIYNQTATLFGNR